MIDNVPGYGPHVQPDGTLQPWLVNILNQVVNRLNAIEEAAGSFTASNVTTDRAFDADSTTVGELADVLGTLISDLEGS